MENLEAPNTFHSNTEAMFHQSLFIADNILIKVFDKINSNFIFQKISKNKIIIMVKGAKSRFYS